MLTIRYATLQFLLIVFGYIPLDFCAATEYSASAKRMMELIAIADMKTISERSHHLSMGIRYLLGDSIVEKNSRKAEGFFLSAQKIGSSRIILKSHLYIALLHFIGEGGINQNYEKAFNDANIVLINRSAESNDRIRAFVLMDEIMHTSDSGIALDLVKVDALFDKIRAVVPRDSNIYDELLYRLARNFTDGDGVHYEQGLCSAIMCLNSLFLTKKSQGELLKKDVDALRARVAALQGEVSFQERFGLPLLLEPIQQEVWYCSMITIDPFFGLYSKDALLSENEEGEKEASNQLSLDN